MMMIYFNMIEIFTNFLCLLSWGITISHIVRNIVSFDFSKSQFINDILTYQVSPLIDSVDIMNILLSLSC
jgi:hypothetical protein